MIGDFLGPEFIPKRPQKSCLSHLNIYVIHGHLNHRKIEPFLGEKITDPEGIVTNIIYDPGDPFGILADQRHGLGCEDFRKAASN
jgi:hypothetical protein